VLGGYVQRGEVATIEEAARNLIDERIAEREAAEADDLSWARPLVDAALDQECLGEAMSREDYQTRNARRIAALK
jgi:antitoxin ParD1/3/4